MDEMQQQYAAPEQNPERALYEKQPKEKKKKSFGAGVATGIVICLFVCMIAGIIIAVNTGRKTGGAAAHLVHVGDTIIIMSYAMMEPEEAEGFKPAIVFPENNQL